MGSVSIETTRIHRVAGLTDDRHALVTLGLLAAVLTSPPSLVRQIVVDTTFPSAYTRAKPALRELWQLAVPGTGPSLSLGSWPVVGR
jgi:hypothetical protein